MLFDLRPKETKEDFFDYKEELDSIVSYLTDKTTRIIVIRGLRRTGKSSLMRVALNKTKVKFVLMDARELTSLSRRSFESKLLQKLRSIKGISAAVLDRIESIEAGVRISLKNDEDIWKLLKEAKPVIAVDEVQMLRGTGTEAFFAALYDNTGCKIILTGSEVGVLDAFIGKDDPKAPLFGRAYVEVKMRPLEPDKSKEFLLSGFREIGKDLDSRMMEKALQELDGIIGWLTMFGNSALTASFENALKNATKKGAELAYSELESFLGGRAAAKKRYIALLSILAEKSMRWADLKRAMEIELKEPISDSQFTNYLDSLVDYGFIITENGVYSIPDPLLKKALTNA